MLTEVPGIKYLVSLNHTSLFRSKSLAPSYLSLETICVSMFVGLNQASHSKARASEYRPGQYCSPTPARLLFTFKGATCIQGQDLTLKDMLKYKLLPLPLDPNAI